MTRRRERRCLINTHLLGLQRPWDPVWHFNTLPGPSLSTHLLHTVTTYGDSSFLEHVLCLHSFRHLGERSKVLPLGP